MKINLDAETNSMPPKLRLRYMLRQCESAIDAIMMGAQSYTIAGQTITRANLDQLTKWRRELMRELALLNGPLRKIHSVKYR